MGVEQVPPAMDEEPTIPIGKLAQAIPAARTDTASADAASAATTVWGSFTLLARVGYGGFGEVYRAWDPQLQREVALKLLLPGAVGGEAEYEAMLREARALASVRHPNIVSVYGIDRHDGRVGFWTDFVHGKTLSVLIAEQGTFGPREAALIGLDVARALSAVHRASLLHRDIKAENVMREEGGRILLMDFGLSAFEQRQTNIAGTPNYMAPELFKGGHSSVATDIYALGVLLYFLVAGDFPVRLGGLSLRETVEALSRRRPLMDLRPDLPESMLRTVSTAMETDPAKRFASAGQLANALAESLGTPAPAELPVVPEEASVKNRSRAWSLTAAALMFALIAGYLVWPGNLQRLLHRANGSDSTLSGASNDEFLKAQDLLLRSYKESNLAEAVKDFQAVLEKDPSNALAEARLGEAYFVQHGYTTDPKLLVMARDATNQATRLNPQLAAPYITLARLAALEGQTQIAIQQVEKALKLEPRSAEAHGARGEVYERQGRGKEALAEYQQAVDLAPDDWRWPMSMGVAEYQQGHIAEAIAQFQRAAELAPDNAMAFYDLSIADRQSGDLEEARKDLQHALDLDPTAQKYTALGSLFLLEGKYDQAAEMEQKAIALDPGNYAAYEDLGVAYSWSGKHHDEAIQAYRKAIELEEAEHAKQRDPVLVAELAGEYAAVGDVGKSLVLARQALALDPNDPTVSYKTGEAFEALGQREKAIPLIAKAVADGYRVYEFEHNPELASLRNDPKFAAMLNELKQKKR